MYHGQKRYLQVLLDPARAELLDRLAGEKDVRVTALVRDMVYEALEARFVAEVYQAAVSRDAETKAAAVQRQVDGRKRRKQLRASEEARA